MRSIVRKIGIHLPLRTPCLHVDNSCASSALYAIYYYRSTVAPRGRTSQVTSRAPTKKTLLVFSKRVRVPAFHHRTRVDQGKYLDIVDNRYGQGLETRRRHGRKTRGLALVHTRYESRAIRPLAGISMEVGRDAVPRMTSRTWPTLLIGAREKSKVISPVLAHACSSPIRSRTYGRDAFISCVRTSRLRIFRSLDWRSRREDSEVATSHVYRATRSSSSVVSSVVVVARCLCIGGARGGWDKQCGGLSAP